MSTTAQDTCLSVRRLTDALTALGDALARPDLDSLLSAEPLLDEVVRALNAAAASPADRLQLLPLLDEARLALRRVELLGGSLMEATQASTWAIGATQGYGRSGRSTQPAAAPALDTRG
jgi:hypothetical protein